MHVKTGSTGSCTRDFIAPGGQCDKLYAAQCLIGSNGLRYLVAIHYRHANVKENQMRVIGASNGQPFLASIGNRYAQSIHLQHLRSHVRSVNIVIDDKNSLA